MHSYVKHNRLSGSPDLNSVKHRITDESWAMFKKNLSPNYLKIWSGIIRNFLMMLLGILVFRAVSQSGMQALQIVMVFPLALWFGFWLHANICYFHEAAHYNIAPSQKLNDLLAVIFLSPFIGLGVKCYRKSHWQHHLNLGTTRDTETSYYHPLHLKRVLSLLTGFFLFEVLARYSRNFLAGTAKNPEAGNGGKPILGFLILMAVVQLSLAGILWFYVSIWCALSWLLAVGLVATAFNVLRQTMEHRALSADAASDYNTVDHGAVNRMFGTSLFARLFGSAGFNRHLLHHWDPSVSYTNFDSMERFLLKTELKDVIETSRTTYFATFKALTK